MDSIIFVLNKLKENRERYTDKYFVPQIWNSFGYLNYQKDKTRDGEICVNPYDFMIRCIENEILNNSRGHKEAEVNTGSQERIIEYLNRSTIYSMFPRMFTAWKHGEDGKIHSGTLLKAICLLPYLKNMGVNIIYLLPVFEYSSKYKKGEIGSPYAIKNIYKIDRNLHDNLLGNDAESCIEHEFKAFVEACHLIGIKVMLDFVFRTVARDSDLIMEHPDWFYWIRILHNEKFSTPDIDNKTGPLPLNDETLKLLYSSKGMKDYLGKFTSHPGKIDSKRWNDIVLNHKKTGKDLLDLIEENYYITTVPGFSDVLNDSQPPWSDVTYLKFYFDVHKKAAEYIEKDQPPYILQDCVKLNLYRGREENGGLFEYVEGVIPHYQEKYNIDGARIDMGHALPPELNRRIVKRTKERNSEFILWSEEFNSENAAGAKNEGFHFITGTIWSIYKYLENEDFNDKLLKHIEKSCIPLTAAPETADTPRLAFVCSDRRKLELVLWVNAFIPKAIPFINNGLELGEIQPMNLGLDNTEDGRFVLNVKDNMYGKLAFFDTFMLHWLNKENYWIYDLLCRIYGIKKEYIDVAAKQENFMYQYSRLVDSSITLLFYLDSVSGRNLFIAANRDFLNSKPLGGIKLFNDVKAYQPRHVNLIYRSNVDKCTQIETNKLVLNPGEVILGYFE